MHLCLPTEEINGAFTVFTQEPSFLFLAYKLYSAFIFHRYWRGFDFRLVIVSGFVRLFFLSPLVPSAFPGELDLTRFCLLLDRTGRKSERQWERKEKLRERERERERMWYHATGKVAQRAACFLCWHLNYRQACIRGTQCSEVIVHASAYTHWMNGYAEADFPTLQLILIETRSIITWSN